MKQKLVQCRSWDLGKIWSKVRAARDKGNLMRYPNLIQRFIRCFSDFAAWVEERIPSRVVQAESALRILQKRRVDPSTFQNNRKEWLRIREAKSWWHPQGGWRQQSSRLATCTIDLPTTSRR